MVQRLLVIFSGLAVMLISAGVAWIGSPARDTCGLMRDVAI